MIVLECIKFHPKGCARWIIVMRLRVLLITHYLIQKILVDVILDAHVICVKIKSLSIHILYNASSIKKIHVKILVLVCIWRIICSLQDHAREDNWANF